MTIRKYYEGIHAALVHAMETDPSVFVMGVGVGGHNPMFCNTADLMRRFGAERVIDTPIAEGAMTGVAIGAALSGLKPVHIHIRVDFLYLATDQLLNLAAKWRYMFGGQMGVPMVVRAIVGRSWGQGSQHSQSLQSLFMHVPGIKVAMPTTPADAQGLLLAAIADPNPVLLIEHRLLYEIAGEVPDPCVPMPFGRAAIRRTGKDITIVATSYMVVECLKAAEFLEQLGIDVELVDPVSLVPLDTATILHSVEKTGALLVADTSWVTCGLGAEVIALVAERAGIPLKYAPRRLGMEPTACPVSKVLEDAFYPNARKIVAQVCAMLGRPLPNVEVPLLTNNFKGPF